MEWGLKRLLRLLEAVFREGLLLREKRRKEALELSAGYGCYIPPIIRLLPKALTISRGMAVLLELQLVNRASKWASGGRQSWSWKDSSAGANDERFV